jgi:hypothetical protein
MHQDGSVANESETGRAAKMTGPTTRTEPGRTRRRTAAVLAVLLLIIGIGLLLYSFVARGEQPQASPAPILTTTPSPITQTRTQPAAPTPSPGATGTTGGSPPVIVITTYVPVTTYVNVPVSSAPQEQDTLALVTTVSGLLASLAGIVSAFVSMRGSRSRQP